MTTKTKTDNGAAPVDELPPPPLVSPDQYLGWATGGGGNIPLPEWEEADATGFDAESGKILVARGGVTRSPLRHALGHALFDLARRGKLTPPMEEQALKVLAGRLPAEADCSVCVSPQSGVE